MTITEFSPDLKPFSFRESIPRSFRARPIGVTTAKKTSVKRSRGAAANMRLATWVATRFTGYSWGRGQRSEVRGQRSEVRGRTTEDGKQQTVLKNVESLKALQSYNRESELPGPRGERTPRWEIKPAHNDQSRGVVIFPGIHRS